MTVHAGMRIHLLLGAVIVGLLLAPAAVLAQDAPDEPPPEVDQPSPSMARLVQALRDDSKEDFVVWVPWDGRTTEIRLSSERQAELARKMLGSGLDHTLVVREGLGTSLPAEAPITVDDMTFWDKIEARDTFMRIMGSRKFREAGLPSPYFILVAEPDGAVTIRVKTEEQAELARRLYGDDVWVQVTDNPLNFEFSDELGSPLGTGLTSLSSATVERTSPDWLIVAVGLGVVAVAVIAIGAFWGRGRAGVRS